jgi:NhaP-type Na+/H+ or K+/H+ antiporter
VLFTKLLLPFEVTSVLILVAILGAVVLARKEHDVDMVPIAYYLILAAILFSHRRSSSVGRFPHQAQRHHHLHVD